MRTRVLIAAAAGLAAFATVPVSAQADAGGTPNGRSDYTFALIGDVPYGAAQIAAFPGWIQQINADRDIRSVVHVGDIKNGSTQCTTSYFEQIRKDVDAFTKPFIYTPGDNEWTDCHRANNGAYNPLERLSEIRRIFFPEPGRTLGQKQLNVTSQAAIGLPENVSYRQKDVSFAAIHLVGSNNSMLPWSGLGKTAPTPEQIADVNQRTNGAITLLHNTFAEATKRGDRAVVIMQQADMFDPTYTPTPNDISAFTPYVQALAAQTRAFKGKVYLFNGDSHIYNSDNPLAPGSPWLQRYGVTSGVTNFERVTCDGSDNNKDWLKVTITDKKSAEPLTWTRIPYTA